jgi:hypothetical protein
MRELHPILFEWKSAAKRDIVHNNKLCQKTAHQNKWSPNQIRIATNKAGKHNEGTLQHQIGLQ